MASPPPFVPKIIMKCPVFRGRRVRSRLLQSRGKCKSLMLQRVQDSGFDEDMARIMHKAIEERKLEKRQTLTDISNDLQRLKLVDT